MSLTPEILQQRYATIERLYSEREWPQVEALSEALLSELPAEADDPVRLRLGLLLGHTRLYGLGAVAEARNHYQQVLDHCSETTLRQIADQGLQQCRLVEEGQGLESSAEAAATPWMEKLAVDVVEEPEQLEVALAGSKRAESLDLQEVAALTSAARDVRPSQRQVDPLSFDPTRLSARELEELSRGLLRLRLS
ncbi:MAG: hypothetical protein AAFX65_02825 [Cyanobacteria bacterium J06638_7]